MYAAVVRRAWSTSCHLVVCLKSRKSHAGVPGFLSTTMVSLLEFRVFHFGFLQDRDIRIGMLPKIEKRLIRGSRTLLVTDECLRTREPQIGQWSQHKILHDKGMVYDFLKLDRCLPALSCL